MFNAKELFREIPKEIFDKVKMYELQSQYIYNKENMTEEELYLLQNWEQTIPYGERVIR